jgi:S-adenosylmethionine:tRNA ribosyltransferase-isomerase
MESSLFDFDLPEKFIAQSPSIPRDNSKLLIYDSINDKIYHKRFLDIVDYLNSDDIWL